MDYQNEEWNEQQGPEGRRCEYDLIDLVHMRTQLWGGGTESMLPIKARGPTSVRSPFVFYFLRLTSAETLAYTTYVYMLWKDKPCLPSVVII